MDRTLRDVDKDALIDELQTMGSSFSDSQLLDRLGESDELDVDDLVGVLQEMGSSLSDGQLGDLSREGFIAELQEMGSTLSDGQWRDILGMDTSEQYQYRDLNFNIDVEGEKLKMKVLFARDAGSAPQHANVSKFTWIGPDILLELGYLDPARYHQLIERVKAAYRQGDELPDLTLEAHLVARVFVSPLLMGNLHSQCGEVLRNALAIAEEEGAEGEPFGSAESTESTEEESHA